MLKHSHTAAEVSEDLASLWILLSTH